MTDPLGQSQVLPYVKGLSQNGYSFDLISFEKKERFDQHKDKIQAICDENNITWHPISYTKKPPLLSTIWDVWRMKRKAKAIYRKKKFELIHCRSYISALVGLHYKLNKNIPFLFDMRGFWADERVDGKIWSLKNPVFRTVYRYFKKKEIQFFKNADHIVSLTENGKNEIESWNDFKEKKLPFSVIPCCVDLDLFDPSNISQQQKTALKSELTLTEEKILGYIGSIGTWYMLPEMLDFFKVWKTENSSGKFLFVSGENPSTILNVAKEKSIDETDVIIRSCPHQEVPLFISIMDLSVFFIRPTYSKKASSPTKQGEIMAMGIPLVCNAGIGDTDRIVLDTNSGYVINELNDANYREVIQKPFDFSAEKLKIGAKQTFDLALGVKEYNDIYKRL